MKQKLNLLLVEDDTDIRESLADFLLTEGYTVESAENGLDALERVQNPKSGKPFDLILLDLMMPVMNGIEFRKKQVADPGLAKIPVLVISADNRTRAIAADIGLHRCILKPMNLDDLLAAIEETENLKTESGPPRPQAPKETERSAW